MLENKSESQQKVEREKSFEQLSDKEFEELFINLDEREFQQWVEKNKSNKSFELRVEKYIFEEKADALKRRVLICLILSGSCLLFLEKIATLLSPFFPACWVTYLFLFLALTSIFCYANYQHFCFKSLVKIDLLLVWFFYFLVSFCTFFFVDLNPPLF